jgi:hypothetical protein
VPYLDYLDRWVTLDLVTLGYMCPYLDCLDRWVRLDLVTLGYMYLSEIS